MKRPKQTPPKATLSVRVPQDVLEQFYAAVPHNVHVSHVVTRGILWWLRLPPGQKLAVLFEHPPEEGHASAESVPHA